MQGPRGTFGKKPTRRDLEEAWLQGPSGISSQMIYSFFFSSETLPSKYRFKINFIFIFCPPALPRIAQVAQHRHRDAAQLWQARATGRFARDVGPRNWTQLRITGECSLVLLRLKS